MRRLFFALIILLTVSITLAQAEPSTFFAIVLKSDRSIVVNDAVIHEGNLIVCGRIGYGVTLSKGFIAVLNGREVKLCKVIEGVHELYRIVFINKNKAVAVGNASIICFDIKSGKIYWSYSAECDIVDAIVLPGGDVIVCSIYGDINILSPEGEIVASATILPEEFGVVPLVNSIKLLNHNYLVLVGATLRNESGLVVRGLVCYMDLNTLTPLWGIEVKVDEEDTFFYSVACASDKIYVVGKKGALENTDIVIVCINLKGEIEWAKAIDVGKREEATDVHIVEDKLYVLGDDFSTGNILAIAVNKNTGALINVYSIGGNYGALLGSTGFTRLYKNGIILPGIIRDYGLVVYWPLDSIREVVVNNKYAIKVSIKYNVKYTEAKATVAKLPLEVGTYPLLSPQEFALKNYAIEYSAGSFLEVTLTGEPISRKMKVVPYLDLQLSPKDIGFTYKENKWVYETKDIKYVFEKWIAEGEVKTEPQIVLRPEESLTVEFKCIKEYLVAVKFAETRKNYWIKEGDKFTVSPSLVGLTKIEEQGVTKWIREYTNSTRAVFSKWIISGKEVTEAETTIVVEKPFYMEAITYREYLVVIKTDIGETKLWVKEGGKISPSSVLSGIEAILYTFSETTVDRPLTIYAKVRYEIIAIPIVIIVAVIAVIILLRKKRK